jgi:hypothetical protein
MSSDENDLIKAEAARYKRATDAAAKSRATLTELVLAELRQPGAKPADIARRADWTPAYVRKLARENGIQADPAYKARTEKARQTLLAQVQAEQTSDSAIATPTSARRVTAPAPVASTASIARLTDKQAAELAQKAFGRATEPRDYDQLVKAEADGDRAVIEAALRLGVIDDTDVLIA